MDDMGQLLTSSCGNPGLLSSPPPSHLSLFLSYRQAEPLFVQVRWWQDERLRYVGWREGAKEPVEGGKKGHVCTLDVCVVVVGMRPDLWLWLFICNTLIISGELGGRMAGVAGVGGGLVPVRGLSSLIMRTCPQQWGDIRQQKCCPLKMRRGDGGAEQTSRSSRFNCETVCLSFHHRAIFVSRHDFVITKHLSTSLIER